MSDKRCRRQIQDDISVLYGVNSDLVVRTI
jgi:hypothetical protein